LKKELKFNKIGSTKLTSELKNSLVQYIAESSKIGELKLPSEVTIANELGVSRIALREVLKELRNDGIIYSIHGKGTYINKNFTNLKFRFTPAREFLKSIQACGFKASVELIDYQIIDADKYSIENLNLEDNDKLLRIHKVFYADDKPVIFCIDTVPYKYFSDIKISESDVTQSTFDFLKDKAFIVVENDIVEITATLSSAIPTNFEKYKKALEHKPLIQMASIYYTLTQEPIMSVKAFFDTEHIKLSQLRKQNVYDDYL
jgi:GntR family transcriptional regulator